jgi:acetate kinase
VRVLVVNAGSSSLKLALLEDEQLVEADTLQAEDGRVEQAAIRRWADRYGEVDAVGHRVVHGGTEFVEPVRVDDRVVDRLRALTALAPLHQPRSLAALDVVTAALPDVPAVACFDTAFHARIPAAAATYALPKEWRERWDLRRFGFHGLSHEYASRRAAELAGRGGDGFRVVTCHLGAGASLAAVRDGVSIDTTMGFTPLEGLVMATRSGSVDPGLILWLEEHGGVTPAELATTLEHGSGLLGLAGSADMRSVLQAEAAGDADAALAVDVYVHRLRAGIATMAAALDGVDAVVFTGGVGEASAAIRERAAAGLGFLGVRLDPAANDAAELDADIAGADSAVRLYAVRAREDLVIVRAVQALLG